MASAWRALGLPLVGRVAAGSPSSPPNTSGALSARPALFSPRGRLPAARAQRACATPASRRRPHQQCIATARRATADRGRPGGRRRHRQDPATQGPVVELLPANPDYTRSCGRRREPLVIRGVMVGLILGPLERADAAPAMASAPTPRRRVAAVAPAATGTHGVLAGLLGGVWHAAGSQAPQERCCRPASLALDAELPGGGWPAGALIDSSPTARRRRTEPAAAAARRHPPACWIVCIARHLLPYAPALANAGRCRWRACSWCALSAASEPGWAARQALLSGSCACVLAWPRRIDNAGLRRLQLAAEECHLLFLFRPGSVAGQPSPAVLRIALAPSPKACSYASSSAAGRLLAAAARVSLLPPGTDPVPKASRRAIPRMPLGSFPPTASTTVAPSPACKPEARRFL